MLRIFALSEKVDLVGYLVVVDKIGEQADNGQRTENNFSCVHLFTPFQLSEKFSTASIIKSTTAPTAWKIGPKGIIHNASFQSVRIEQFAGHLMKEFRVVQHFLDFFLRAAVIQECLHFISVTPNAFATLNRSS